jgi:hypothetical protein
VQGFLDANAERFAAINTSSTRRSLDTTVAQLTAHAADQEGGTRSGLGETARQRSLRKALRIHHMRAIAEAAKIKLRAVPEFRALTMPDVNVKMEQLLAAASAMADAAKQHEQTLIDTGLPEGFLGKLVAATDAVRASIEEGAQSRGRRAGGTAGLSSDGKRGRSMLKILDSLVIPIIGDDEKLIAQWRSALRIPRKPGPVAGSDAATAPVPAVNPVDGPAGEAPKAA